jgi:hypothetical protein
LKSDTQLPFWAAEYSERLNERNRKTKRDRKTDGLLLSEKVIFFMLIQVNG